MDQCDFAYPTVADAQKALCHLQAMANGSDAVDEGCARHCGWVLKGYLCSQQEACAGKKAVLPMFAIDWLKLLQDFQTAAPHLINILRDLGLPI